MMQLTEQNFKKEISDAKVPILVDFYASWCGPCQMLTPVLEDLSQDAEYKGKLRFAKLSTEDYPNLAQEHNVQGIPCMIFMQAGKEVGRIVGFAPKPVLKSKINSMLDNIKGK